jgi:hypothetical protein
MSIEGIGRAACKPFLGKFVTFFFGHLSARILRS